MIHGVKLKELKVVADERGLLMEMWRADDPDFEKFRQVYLTMAHPGVVKAWHLHERQTDHFVCVSGIAKVVLFDDRHDSPTRGEIDEFVIGGDARHMIIIPPLVYHGYTPVGAEPASIINVPTELYDYDSPDEQPRPWNDPAIGYDWGVTGR